MPTRVLAAAVLVAVTLAGCNDRTDAQPGNPEVYQRIAAETNCTALQKEFDTASASHDRADAGSAQAEAAVGYMNAADERMRTVGCY